jgi:hypothetical protein
MGGIKMSTSEFRYNKKRKHYAYVFKTIGYFNKNILLSTKQTRIWKGKIKKNIKLSKHPNPNSVKTVYVIPIIYIDKNDSFHQMKLKWYFDKNDKRIIKRIKRGRQRK